MKKAALLIGINYTGTQHALEGCINDVNNVCDKLLRPKGYTDIKMLTDFSTLKPTKENIIRAIIALVTVPNATLYLHYSGHGTNVRDSNGDEKDRYDEAIVPLDCDKAGVLTDDDIRSIISKNMAATSTLYAVFDSCFSGSVMDLRYTYKSTDFGSTKFFVETKYSTTPGRVFFISGCRDDQTAAEVNGQGALTNAYIETLVQNQKPTIENLVLSIRKLLLKSSFTQVPQLSCGRAEPVNSFFEL